MKKYNKILSSLAIACLLTSTLNGCGNNTLKESETKAAQEETLQMEDSNEETLENGLKILLGVVKNLVEKL